MTRSELTSLDLATISAIRMVLGTAFKNQVCKWEQEQGLLEVILMASPTRLASPAA